LPATTTMTSLSELLQEEDEDYVDADAAGAADSA